MRRGVVKSRGKVRMRDIVSRRPPPSRPGRRLLLGSVLLAGTLATPAARADLWSYEDAGNVYFTNIPPQGQGAHKWRIVSRSGPGKAQTMSGAGPAGCQA